MLANIQSQFKDRIVLDAKILTENENKIECIIFCVWKEREFVTWYCNNFNGYWSCNHGHYFTKLLAALKDFKKRK